MTLVHLKPGALLITLCLGVSGCFYGCAGPPRVKPPQGDRAFVEAIVAARAAFQQGRIDEAETLYTLALKRARALDRPSAIGDTAYNLAACLLLLREYEHARTFLVEARHELARGESPLADVLLLQARAARLAGDIDAASVFIRQLRTDPKSRASSAHLGQAVILESHIACDRQDWSSAAGLLAQAHDDLGPDADTLLQAQLAGLAGRIATAEQNFRTAAEAFERQAMLLCRAGHFRALGAALAQAGEAYLALDEDKLAADTLYRAARSAAAWDDTAKAKKWAQAALAAAHNSNDSVIVHLAESLLSEFSNNQP